MTAPPGLGTVPGPRPLRAEKLPTSGQTNKSKSWVDAVDGLTPVDRREAEEIP